MVLAQKQTYESEWNRIGSPEVNQRFTPQLIYNNGEKKIHNREDRLFNKWC